MASEKKVTDLTSKAAPLSTDVLYIVDLDDNSDKKCTIAEFLTGTALTIGATATTTTFAGTITVAEGITCSDGQVAITDNSNAAAGLIIQNDTITTFGNGTTEDAGMVVFSSDTLTTGDLLRLQLDESALNGGAFLKCVQTDAPAAVFTVAENGATTIAGVAGSTVFTITAGDAVLSDASVAITDADNAATFSVTNNTATTASVIVLAGSGVFTGSTTTSFMTITPSGLTTGTGVYLPLAALTTGYGAHVTSGATLTTGSLLYVQDTGANCAVTSGRAATFDLTATAITGTVNKIGSGVSVTSNRTTTTGTVADDWDLLSIVRTDIINGAGSMSAAGSVLYIENAVTNTSGTVTDTANGIEVVMDSLGTGDGIKVTHASATGKALNVVTSVTTGTSGLFTAAALTQGKVLHLTSGATQTTGSLLYVQNTGADAALTSGTVATFDHTATAIAASVNKIGSVVSITSNRTVNTGGTTADDFDLLSVIKATTRTAGTAATAGSAVYVEVQATGTVTETSNGIEVVMDAGGTGDGIKITHSAVAGKALNIVSSATTAAGVILVTADALTTGQVINLASSATAITGAGRMFLSNHSGATGGSATLNEFATAATDETVLLQATASAALAAGKIVNVSGVAMTTGTALSIADLNALTTGQGINVTSNSADATARALVYIKNDHASAAGAMPLQVVNDSTAAPINTTGAAQSTHFFKVLTGNGVTIWMSDGTTANSALAATTGDICLNAGSNKPEYCTNGAGSAWSALV